MPWKLVKTLFIIDFLIFRVPGVPWKLIISVIKKSNFIEFITCWAPGVPWKHVKSMIFHRLYHTSSPRCAMKAYKNNDFSLFLLHRTSKQKTLKNQSSQECVRHRAGTGSGTGTTSATRKIGRPPPHLGENSSPGKFATTCMNSLFLKTFICFEPPEVHGILNV